MKSKHGAGNRSSGGEGKCPGCGREILATLDGGEVWFCYYTDCKLYGREIPKPTTNSKEFSNKLVEPKEWEKRFEYFYGAFRLCNIVCKQDHDRLKQFIADTVAQSRKDTANEICKLIDDLELKQEFISGSTLEEWKQWKRIRNAIRDRFLDQLKK